MSGDKKSGSGGKKGGVQNTSGDGKKPGDGSKSGGKA